MSWHSTTPPIDPPEPRTMACPDCEGEGQVILYEHGAVMYDGDCGACDGSGLTDFDPDLNPYAPDTWKEAEGIA